MRLPLTLAIAILTPCTVASAQDPVDPAPHAITRVVADSSGTSHFVDDAIDLAAVDLGPGIPPVGMSEPMATARVRFACFEPGAFVDWHAAPRHQYYFILSGTMEMEVSDGEKRTFGPGDVLFATATHGPGVRVRWTRDERPCTATVASPE